MLIGQATERAQTEPLIYFEGTCARGFRVWRVTGNAFSPVAASSWRRPRHKTLNKSGLASPGFGVS